MLRLIGFLCMATLGIGGFLYVDFTSAKRNAGTADGQGLTVGAYLGGFTERLTGIGSSASSASGLPTELARMLPAAPEGWTVRPAVPEDTEPFLAKSKTAETNAAAKYIAAVAAEASGSGVDQAALTYERGERRVIFQAVRYPNSIFTSFTAMQQRYELQMQGAMFRPTPFMTVRGLDVTEDLLPKGMRARYFLADVGAQIQIRVLASQRMGDDDLVPFFQTLHVKAMNTSVVDKVAGLGDVPVIVLASALDPATREAFEADRAARAAAEAAERAADLQAAEAEAKAAEAQGDAPPKANATTDASVLKGEGRLELQGKAAAAGCGERAGGKFCSVAPPPAEGE